MNVPSDFEKVVKVTPTLVKKAKQFANNQPFTINCRYIFRKELLL